MPEIRPFRGWRYNPEKTGDLARVYAPPYDVISKKEREAFYRRHAHNVIRLILGKERKGDDALHNRYTRAAKFLRDWKASRVLVREASPAVYVYAQDYREKGRVLPRMGFMAAMRLDERLVMRHENTLAKPKEDRMALLKEVKTNLSPIFGLFEDPSGGVQKRLRESMRRRPSVDVTIDGVRHRLYVEQEKGRIEKLTQAMRRKPLFIADGHHRFEVACQFRKWMRSRNPGAVSPGWDTVMTYFSDCLHNPFTIYPTHRLVRLPKEMKNPLAVLEPLGELVKVPSLAVLLVKLEKPLSGDARPYVFGVYRRKEGFFLFYLNDRVTASLRKDPVGRLEPAALHEKVLKPCFGIGAIEKSESIDFTRDPKEACDRVRKGEFDAAFFLRPTALHEMLAVAKKGLKMPQKSTYFYPKLLSGLVFHGLEEDP